MVSQAGHQGLQSTVRAWTTLHCRGAQFGVGCSMRRTFLSGWGRPPAAAIQGQHGRPTENRHPDSQGAVEDDIEQPARSVSPEEEVPIGQFGSGSTSASRGEPADNPAALATEGDEEEQPIGSFD